MLSKLKDALRSKTERVVYYGRYNDIWPTRSRSSCAHLFSRFCAFCCRGDSTFTSEADAEKDAFDHARTHTGVTVQHVERSS